MFVSFAGFIESISAAIWGAPMMAAFLGVGGMFSVRTGFFQLFRIKTWFANTIVSAFRDKSARKSGENSISQLQALTATLAACIGTGNIVGVATAISAGGPGAVFWMCVSAALGMMTSCAENILGIKYRYKDEKGEWMGGAMVYIERGLGLKRTAKVFSVFLIFSSLGIGNMTQGNSVAEAVNGAFGVKKEITGLVLCVVTALVIFGGIKRIATLAEKLIPAMSVVFTLASLAVIICNRAAVPGVIKDIFTDAFSFNAAAGGAAGYGISRAMRYGISRGVFSNEAGLGSSAIIHAAADVETPAKQGLWGILEVFIDTILMCTLTAITILSSGAHKNTSLNGAQMSSAAFASVFGNAGEIFVSLSVCVFAFATLVSWSYYGKRGAQYLLGHRAAGAYNFLYAAITFFGCVVRLETVWSISDIFNGLMAIPNLAALVLLSGEAVRELKTTYPPAGQGARLFARS